jgi:N utilization substance protein B
MSRKQAREAVFKRIYSLGFLTDVIYDEQNIPPSEHQYIDNLYNSVSQNLEKIDSLIKGVAKDFSFDRLFKIDLAALRLGIGEMLFTDTPKPVAVNAAVEIAKKYSTEKSASFVNGVLAEVLKTM